MKLLTSDEPQTEVTWSTDTDVHWIDEAWTRRRWGFGNRLRFGPRITTGTWFATHRDWPGMWGDGPTPEEALDELIDTARECKALFPEWPECDDRFVQR